jgi:PAS domain S-box-containing protein
VLGYGAEELLGKSIFEFVHGEDLAQVYSAFFNVIEGIHEDFTVQFRHRTSDGSFRIIEATLGKLSDCASKGVVLSLRPITASERLDAARQPTVVDASEFTTIGPATHKDGVHSVMR